ncbi:hypothetical protein NLI96_g11370 [Meripilus lineatus]|uniref:Uncharacterized protein n=1 Tax=Meripilus lineatus TaxID=2056292 RepID=A0AAD5UWS7_9APHY|nr:hypothetical protein NLI96_g11370 [Physisporinus lineatus]
MHNVLFYFLSFALSVISVRSQTITTTNAQGATIVQVISTDPVALTPVTSIVQTLAATPTSPPSVVTASIGGPDVQQGPVGQPAPTLQQAPSTVYTYTTTDANGNTVAIVDTYTPSFPSSRPPVRITSGSILPYSEWLSLVGTNTVLPAHSAAMVRWSLENNLLLMSLGVLTGMLGGAWLAIL